jgi:hypothetical protein
MTVFIDRSRATPVFQHDPGSASDIVKSRMKRWDSHRATTLTGFLTGQTNLNLSRRLQ